MNKAILIVIAVLLFPMAWNAHERNNNYSKCMVEWMNQSGNCEHLL
jgi:hypothetical protein